MNNFYSPSKDFPKIIEKIEAVMNTGLDCILTCIREFVGT